MIKCRSKETRNQGRLPNILTNAARTSQQNDKLLENLTMTAAVVLMVMVRVVMVMVVVAAATATTTILL
jgi:hypothetical protein